MQTATIKLTKEELWELMNNFDKSFDEDDADNEIANRVSAKLAAAYEKMA